MTNTPTPTPAPEQLGQKILAVIEDEIGHYERDHLPLEDGAVAAVHARVMIVLGENSHAPRPDMAKLREEIRKALKLGVMSDMTVEDRILTAIAPFLFAPAQPGLIDRSQCLTTSHEYECHGLDTPKCVFFYEQEFYVLSNFSAFSLMWKGKRFDTSEAAYHWEKFPDDLGTRYRIYSATSAHEAFKIAERFKEFRRPDWDAVKVDVMREILRAKADQHEYVRRKLLATGNRELIENSWRDDFWGWGPNQDGKNMLGKLWMELRAELRAVMASGKKEGA